MDRGRKGTGRAGVRTAKAALGVNGSTGQDGIARRELASTPALIHAVPSGLQSSAERLGGDIDGTPFESDVGRAHLPELEVPQLFGDHADAALIEAGGIVIVDEDPLPIGDSGAEISLANEGGHQLFNGNAVLIGSASSSETGRGAALGTLYGDDEEDATQRVG